MPSKKDYSDINQMRDEVTEVEEIIADKLDSIWTDDTEREYYLRLNGLSLSDKRLWIVYSLLDCSIIRTARHFSCHRGTIREAIENIKKKIYGTTIQKDTEY